jgi:tetratricopeptide (TPR) repeat protein
MAIDNDPARDPASPLPGDAAHTMPYATEPVVATPPLTEEVHPGERIELDPALIAQLKSDLEELHEEPRGFVLPQPAQRTQPYWEQREARLRAELGAILPEVTDPSALGALARRGALLAFELGRLYEYRLGRPSDAITAYQRAHALDPTLRQNLRALVRVLERRGSYALALPLRDHELTLAGDREKAALHLERGRLRECFGGDPDGAVSDYWAALEHGREPAALLALIELERRRGHAAGLVDAIESHGDCMADAAVEAALLVEAAWVAEDRLSDIPRAIRLLERARPRTPVVLRALTRLHRRAGNDAAQAALHLEAAGTTSGSDAASLLQRGARLYQHVLGDRDQATRALERATREEPGNRALLVDLASLYDHDEKWPQLAATLATAAGLTGDPRQASALYYRLGLVATNRLGDVDWAARAFREAIDLTPDHHPARRALGKLLAESGRWRELSTLVEAEATETQDAERSAARLYVAAEIWERKLNDHGHARALYERALVALPGYDPAQKGVARCASALGDIQGLAEAYERELVVAIDHDEEMFLLSRIATLYEELGATGLAIERYERLLVLEPGQPIALRALERLYERTERSGALVQVLLSQADQSPTDTAVGLLVRAAALSEEKLGDPDAALGCYRDALMRKPGFLPALLGLGRLAQKLGRTADLVDMYRHEIEHASGESRLALLHFKMGELLCDGLRRPDEAVGAYLEALRHDPMLEPARERLARIHEAKGNWIELALVWSRQRESSDRRARAVRHFRLARVQEQRLHNAGTAAESYRRALKAHPGSVAARAALENLLRASQDRQALASFYASYPSDDPATLADVLSRQARLVRHGDAELDTRTELLARRLALDPSDRLTRRALMRLYRRLERWQPYVELLEAEFRETRDSAFALACALEAAQLRQSHLKDPRGAAGLYRSILRGVPEHPEALAQLERHLAAESDASQLLGVLDRMTACAESPAEAACLLTAVGAVHEHMGAADRAAAAYQQALERVPDNFPAVRALVRLARAGGDAASLARLVETEAAASRDPVRRAALYFAAAEMWRTDVADLDRATAAYQRVLTIEPAHEQAISALDTLLSARSAWPPLADLLGHAAANAHSAMARRDLEIRIAEVARDRLNDPDRARAAYRRALTHDPQHAPTIKALSEVCRAQGDFREVAELVTRLLELGASESAARRMHLELASIWDEKLPEPRLAIEHYRKALTGGTRDQPLLERISLLLMQERDWAGAEQVVADLIKQANSPQDKLRYRLRLGTIYTDGLGDTDAAEAVYRDALALAPNNADAIERLALVLGRSKDKAALDNYLSGLAVDSRKRIRQDPGTPEPFVSLRRVFEWQEGSDGMFLCSQMLHVLGGARPDDEAFLRTHAVAGAHLARRQLEPHTLLRLLDPRERRSFRELLQIGEPALDQLNPGNLARQKVRSDQLVTRDNYPRLYELMMACATGFGMQHFEVYVGGHAEQVAVENTDVPAVVLGTKWVKNGNPLELRFLLGSALGRVRLGLIGAVRISPEELGLFAASLMLLGGSAPPLNYPIDRVQGVARRVDKLLSRKAVRDLRAVAARVGRSEFKPREWRKALKATALRAGALMCGDAATALEMTLRLDGGWQTPAPPKNALELRGRIATSAGATDVATFMTSDDHLALRAGMGVTVGTKATEPPR